jgi:hypothetical protein
MSIAMLKPDKLKQYSIWAILFCSVVLIWLMAAGLLTYTSFRAVKAQKWGQAAGHAQAAQTILAPVFQSPLQGIPSMNLWQQSLKMINLAAKGQPHLKQTQQGLTDSNLALANTKTLQYWQQLNQTYAEFYQAAQNSYLAKKFIPKKYQKTLKASHNLMSIAQVLLPTILSQDTNFTILLQNNDELRAGGGFIGSVITIQTQNNHLTQPIFYDIYDLVGQTETNLPSPAGHYQFLSAGRGMSLADANWQADFTLAAQDILQLLKPTNLPQTDLLIAINLDLVERLLELTGPIYLPDYEQTVTSENLSQLARANRLQFFAGDQQKKDFLQQLYLQLALKLPKTISQNPNQFIQTLSQAFQHKEIILYSLNPDLQQSLEALPINITHSLQTKSDYWLYLLESNVGINKANHLVERQVNLNIQKNQIQIKLIFDNHNQPLSQTEIELIENNPDLLQATHLGYVNYQRLLTNFEIQAVQASCNQQKAEIISQEKLQLPGANITQIGFLITVPEQTQVECQVELQPAKDLQPAASWTLFKQPGLPPTPYQVKLFNQEQKFVLESDYFLSPQ